LREVSHFEACLIRVLRCIVSGSPADGILDIVHRESPRPECLSRDCVELVKDALRKGVTRRCAVSGWKRERFLRGVQQGDERAVVEGRLWQRRDLESQPLVFSEHVVNWLIWITATPVPDSKKKVTISYDECSLGDRLFFLLAFETFLDTNVLDAVCRQALFQSHPLVSLFFPLAASRSGLDFSPGLDWWFQPEQAWVLETFQGVIGERWLQMERVKSGTADWSAVQKMGELQQRLLDQVLTAAESSGRWDLVRFVMDAAVGVLSEVDVRAAADDLDLTGLKLSQRQQVREASLALLRSLECLARRNEQARTIGFYDEDYEASQLWKSDWERWNGDAVCRKASEIEQSLLVLSTT
jgi:hypothetical protein